MDKWKLSINYLFFLSYLSVAVIKNMMLFNCVPAINLLGTYKQPNKKRNINKKQFKWIAEVLFSY